MEFRILGHLEAVAEGRVLTPRGAKQRSLLALLVLHANETLSTGGIIVTRDRGYELRLDPERLDSHQFELLVAEGRGELAQGRPERAVRALERALSLWGGPPLADVAYERFAEREVARLADLRTAALEP